MVATNLSTVNGMFWNCLPTMYTNFGNDTQITNIDAYNPYNLTASFSPMAAATYGTSTIPSSIFNCYAAAPGVAGGGCSSQAIQQAAVANAQALSTPALNNIGDASRISTLNMIAQAKSLLDNKRNQPGVSEEDKQKIQEYIDKLIEQEKKIQELAKDRTLDPATGCYKMGELEVATRQLKNEAVDFANSVAVASTETTGSTGTTGTTEATDTTGASESTETSNETAQGTVDNFDTATRNATDQIYDAIEGLGTNDKKMREVLDLVDKDNVMDLVLCWNKYHSAQHGESLMKAFMWDASSGFCCAGGDKVKYGKLMARALRDKAEELGVYDECAADFAAIDKEMSSTFYVSNDVYKNYDNIVKVIGDKMGSKYSSPYAKGGASVQAQGETQKPKKEFKWYNPLTWF